ncbi:MAG: ComEA family DNA-binding protein [Rhodothermaceae bacterium]|nr:ComEA family DNA-binding protein [Rhodothermaceae bacterium]
MKERARIQDSLNAVEAHAASVDSVTIKDVLFAGGNININTASQEELERLPRIGPAMAQRILTYRQTHGPFKNVDDLTNVKGIGPKTLDRLRDKVTLDPSDP